MRTIREFPKYTKVPVDVIVYDTGLMDWGNMNAIYSMKVRDKIICKLDAMEYLNEYFSPETIKQYRDALWFIATGQCKDAQLLSELINEFINIDDKFASKIYDIFVSCPEDRVFGYYLMEVLAITIMNVEDMYRSFFRHKTEVVICLDKGYLYFSISDKSKSIELPDDIKCEVLYVKNWQGKFICKK